ncbi:hypothetical protein [Lacinutrix undariae]
MKTTILSVICILIVVLIVSGCANYIGIPKKKAASNLKAYLQREYNGKLTFDDLRLFFNAATMDPNMYTVHIFDEEIPEIEFYTHLNLKNILEDDSLPMYAKSDAMTFDILYKEALKRYNVQQVIIADFKNEISEIIFNYEVIELSFNTNLSPEELNDIITRFISRLSQSIDDLDSAYNQNLLIKTPQHPEGFITISLEVENFKYKLKPYFLSEDMAGFKALETQIETNIQAKLDSTFPKYKINNYRKIFIDKSSLSKGAWVQYLDDKTVKKDSKGKWVNPQKGLYIVYFDLQSSFIYRGEMITENNDKTSYDEELEQITNAIEAEGLIIK